MTHMYFFYIWVYIQSSSLTVTISQEFFSVEDDKVVSYFVNKMSYGDTEGWKLFARKLFAIRGLKLQSYPQGLWRGKEKELEFKINCEWPII